MITKKTVSFILLQCLRPLCCEGTLSGTRHKPLNPNVYPTLIHWLTYRRTNHKNLHVRGYKEEGTTTTPFDMVVLNDLDRFHLAGDVIDRVPSLGSRAAYAKQFLRDKLLDHKKYIQKHGEDMPEIRNWKWSRNETQKKKSLAKKKRVNYTGGG